MYWERSPPSPVKPSSAEFHLKRLAYFPSCPKNILSQLCLYQSPFDTWFHWNSWLYPQNSTPGWLKGFPVANGKRITFVHACMRACASLCVCVWSQQHTRHRHTVTSPSLRLHNLSLLSRDWAMMSAPVDWEIAVWQKETRSEKTNWTVNQSRFVGEEGGRVLIKVWMTRLVPFMKKYGK